MLHITSSLWFQSDPSSPPVAVSPVQMTTNGWFPHMDPPLCLGRKRLTASSTQWKFLMKRFGFFAIILFYRSHMGGLKSNGASIPYLHGAFAPEQK